MWRFSWEGMCRDFFVGPQNHTKPDCFLLSLDKLAAKSKEGQIRDPEYTLSFDKDDDDILDFVAATSNLRAIVYGIATQSRFKIKGWFYLLFKEHYNHILVAQFHIMIS